MANKYLIGDLAEKAGITVRTIRYYFELGLLPEPDRPGKFAYYTDEHLERLEVIRKLKDLRLPLWEIEQVLKKPDSGELQNLMERMETSNPQVRAISIAPDEGKATNSALEYIEYIMGAQQQVSGSSKSPMQLKAQPPLSKSPMPAQSSRWTRIEISPDIEIHCRQPLGSRQQKKLDQLIELAKQLFER